MAVECSGSCSCTCNRGRIQPARGTERFRLRLHVIAFTWQHQQQQHAMDNGQTHMRRARARNNIMAKQDARRLGLVKVKRAVEEGGKSAKTRLHPNPGRATDEFRSPSPSSARPHCTNPG
jgi:hypothetical protein